MSTGWSGPCFTFAAALACSVASSDQPSLPGGERDPSGRCPPGMDCGAPSDGECSGIHATCSQGALTTSMGSDCQLLAGRCELGCRQDYAPNTTLSDAESSEERALELSRRLCEEYRLQHGARRPGDACAAEFDCLPHAPGSPQDGMPWPELMTCGAGRCEERTPSVPADLGMPCVPDEPPAISALSPQGSVLPGSCQTGLCNVREDAGGLAAHCTMQCKDDAGCPQGWVCHSLSIGPIVDPYSFGSGGFCVDPCSWIDCGAGDAGPMDAAGAAASGGSYGG